MRSIRVVGSGLKPAKNAVSVLQVGRHFFRRNYRQLRVIDNCGERNGWVVAGRPGRENGSNLNRDQQFGWQGSLLSRSC